MKKYRIIMLCLFILSILCLFSRFSLLTFGTSNLNLDYSKLVFQDSHNIASSRLVEIMVGEDITNNEKEYLDENFEELKYNDKIPTSFVNTNLIDGVLDIHAQEYSYIDDYNRVITWIPYKVTINNYSELLIKDNDFYKCEINVNDIDDTIRVEYISHISILKDSANTLINAAYNKVNDYVLSGEKETEEAKYNAQLAEYNAYLVALDQYNQDYEDYLLYLEQKEKYDKYLVDLEKYNAEEEAYQNYLIEKETYPSKLLAYQNYLIALENYNATSAQAIAEYQEYVSKMNIVNHQLYIMSLLKTKMTSLERTIYDAVMGSTVTEVLNRKSELVQLGVKEETIDRAYVATVNLRKIFTDYFGLNTEQEQYTYYCINYYNIKKNIEELCRTLDKLYRSGATVSALDITSNREKYIILVAQLALVSIMLDTDQVYNYEAWNPKTNKGNLKLNGALVIDFNWTIDDRNIDTILEHVNYIDDSSITALPLYSGYPSPVAEPEPPTEVLEPTYPSPVSEPVRPTEVSAPTSTVTEAPVKPVAVECPTPYVVPSDIQSLLEVYNTSLCKRDEFSSDYNLIINTEFDKKFKNLNELVVEFYNTNGEYITKYIVNNGSYIVYDNILPTKPNDVMYTYKFVGWEYENHELLDLNNVTREGFVYPVFENILNTYVVTWNVNNQEFNETYNYGEMPSFKGSLIKDNTTSTIYQFDKWDKDIEVVSSDVTYLALYKEINLENNVLKIEDNNIKELLENITNFENINLVIENDNSKITIPQHTLIKLKNDNVNEVQLKVVKDGYSYSIEVLIDGELKDNNYQFNVTIEAEFDNTHSSLYQINGEEKEKIRYDLEENSLSFIASGNYRYQFFPMYTISFLENDMIDISINKTVAMANDIIEVTIDNIANGIKIDKIYVINSLKQELEINSNDSSFHFNMTNDDVYIGIAYSYIEYKITFISDDVVIMESKYHYGDEVILPSMPMKANDDKYSYEFVSWSPEVTDVSEDAIYIAIFDRQEVQIEPIQDRVSIILILKIGLVVGLSCACIGLVIALTTNKKAKKI